MAQVIITPGNSATNTNTTGMSLAMPAAAANETLVIVVGHDVGSGAVGIADYVLDSSSDVDTWPNRLRRFIRQGPVSAGTATITFNSACYAKAYAYHASGLPFARARNVTTQSTYTIDPTVPPVNGAVESAIVYEVLSGSYPRSYAPPAGATEIYDSFIYSTVGGVSLGVGWKNGVAGLNSLGLFDATDADNPALDGGDYWRLNAISFAPYVAPGGSSATVGGSPATAFVYAPSNVLATQINDRIMLLWTDATPDETAYETRIRIDAGPWTYAQAQGPLILSHEFAGVIGNTVYTVGVRAVRNGDGSAWVDRSITTTSVSAPLAAPSGLIASGITQNSVTLGWTLNGSGQTAVEVWGNRVGEPELLFSLLSASATSVVIYGLAPNSQYQMRARVVNGIDVSSFSASAFFTTLDIYAPTDPGSSADSPNIDLVDPCCRVVRNRNLRRKC